MKNIPQLSILLLVTVFVITAPLCSQDRVEDILRREFEVPLRWDNIERKPQWVSGIPPQRRGLRGNHEVTLSPGESTCIRIPAYESLRIISGKNKLFPNDLDVSVSNGSGLLASIPGAIDLDRKSLFFEPRSHIPLLAYISRPQHCDKALTIGLFTSRHEPLQTITNYRGLIRLSPERKVRMGSSKNSDSLEFWKWNEGDGVQLKLRGPGRFRLETRYRYPDREVPLTQSYQILVHAMDPEKATSPLSSVDFVTGLESSGLVFVNRIAEVTGRLETGYFDLPEDREYQIALETTAPLYIRVLELEKKRFLAPSLNAPKPSTSEFHENQFQGSPWEIPTRTIEETLRFPRAMTADKVERVGMRLARDNSRSQGGMMAATLMWNAGWHRHDYEAIRQRWRDFSTFTYYRNAMPQQTGKLPFRTAYFPVRNLHPIGKDRDLVVLGESQIPSAFGRLPEALFSTIQKNEPTVFLLPERQTPTRIRIVARRDRDRTADFEITIPGEDSRHLRLLPDFDAPRIETRPSAGVAAMQFINGGTLDAPASFLRNSAETVSAGYYEFTVPPDVQQIELKNSGDSENVPVALQYRSSDLFAMSEDEYAAMATRAGSKDVLLQWLLTCVSRKEASIPEGSRTKKELYNHWEPLRRFIQSRHRQFIGSVSPGSIPDSAIGELDHLEAEGELYLAEQLARSFYVHSQDRAIQKQAFRYLEKVAGLDQDSDPIIVNACVKLIEEPDTEKVIRLASLLREAGESELTLMLALVIPKDPATRELRLASTFQRKWWAHFEAILGEAPDSALCRVWRGIRLWHMGKYELAKQEWNSAGETGRSWFTFVENSESVREQVLNGDPGSIRNWYLSEANTPSLSLWKTLESTHVEACQSAVTLRVRERGNLMEAFIATPAEPLQVNFPGPELIEVECRPIHPAGSISPREGWIEITGSGSEPIRIPVLSNFPSAGLSIVGREQESPGAKVTELIALTSWNNQVQIRPDFGPVLVRIKRRVPEVRAGHLPPLTMETAAWLFNQNRQAAIPQPESNLGEVAIVDHSHSVTWHPVRSPFFSSPESAYQEVFQVFQKSAPVPLAHPYPDRSQIIRKVRQLLIDSQSGNADLETNAIAAGPAEWQKHRNIPEIKSLVSAILRRTSWEPLLSSDRNAGFREIETPGWEPESPTLRTRMRFLPDPGPSGYLVTGIDSTVALLTNREPNKTSVHLTLDTIPFLVSKHLIAKVEVEGKPPVTIKLDQKNASETLHFDLPKGQSSIRIEVTDTVPNQYLRVEFDSENEKEALYRKTKRSWFVAYPDEPLSARIDGPAWVRIDQRTEEGVQSEYRHITEKVGQLTLSPDQAEEALYRIHVLRLDPNKPYLPFSYTKRNVSDVPSPSIRQTHDQPAKEVQFDDQYGLSGQEDGTWTAGISKRQRLIEEEDNDKGVESYLQGDLTYRFYNEDRRTYTKATVLTRHRDAGEMTVGLRSALQYNPLDSPFTYSFDGSIFEQGGEWSFYGIGSVSTTQKINPKWKHTPSLSIFGRGMSLDDAGAYPGSLDRDVFTEFKSNHKRGLRLNEKLVYTPWEDTRFYASAGLGTNEDFISLDSINYRIGVDQILGPVRLGADITGYRFFDDDDRLGASSRHRLNLEATGEFWSRSQDRFELGVRYSHYFEEDESTVSIFGRWHFGEGRMLRDFSPDEKPFSKIRERRMPRERNNAVHKIR